MKLNKIKSGIRQDSTKSEWNLGTKKIGNTYNIYIIEEF